MSEREQNNKRFGANHQITQQSHLHAQLVQQSEHQLNGTQPMSFGSKFQSLQKLKPIHGGGANGGSLISQTNNGMSYIGQMDSSNNRIATNPSANNLQKCNSSPMNSFIKKSNSRPQVINVSTAMFLNQQSQINTMTQVNNVGSHTNIYNSTQPPFRGGDVVNHEMDNTPSSSHHQIVDPRFVYKSNSQKSINWEGTPQNHTHKSINNKNTGSQSHQSLLGSQGKIIQTASSKKMLMPSGSSGTLLRKERKLNFTGKPFAPDSIFVNSIGKNQGDDDEGAEIDQIDIVQLKGNQVKSSKNVQVQQNNQAKNYHTAQSQQQTAITQSITNGHSSSQQVKEQVKIQTLTIPKRIANVRNQSPPDVKKTSTKEPIPNKQKEAFMYNGRASINAQQLHSQEVGQTKKPILKGNKQSTGPTAKRQMANHHPQTFQVALSDLNNISSNVVIAKQESSSNDQSQKIQLNQTQKMKASFADQNASHNLGTGSSGNNTTTQKDESIISNNQNQNLNKQKPQTSTQILSHNLIKNNRSAATGNIGTINAHKTSTGLNVSQIVNAHHGPQYSSKSPAEKMIESSLLQNQTLITNASSAAQVSSRKITIDQYNMSVQQQQVQTPQRHQIQSSGIRKAGNSKPKQQQQTKQAQSGSFQKPPERMSLQGSAKAKTSQYELDVQSPSQQHKLSSKSQFKMKGDTNNFNDISINEGEHIIREDEDELIDNTPFLRNNENMNERQQMFQRVDQSNSNSPQKSNKVPSSLSFKRRSDDQGETMEIVSKRFTMHLPEKTKTLVDIDESSMAAVSARGNKNNIFTLKDKQELKRNIPKFHNLDFSGQSSLSQVKNELRRDSSTKSASLRRRKMQGSVIIMTTKILSAMVQFFDFENLMKMMSIMKKFREDFTKHPTSFQAQVFRIFKHTLRNLLVLGLPSTIQRIQYWNFKTKFFYGKKKKPNLYKTLKRQKADDNAAAEIRKDVHRTFPDMKYFQIPQKGQAKLFNILNAVAQKNSQTGYIQGMNFLAGTILINLQKGEETFWMMMSILNKYKFDSILDLKNGGLFQILCYQLETFMLAYLPTLANHLKYLRIPTDIYAANWFITMFCYELSLDLVFCILDVFLLEGIKSLIRVSLALLKAMQEDLLKMNYDECMEFLSHCQKDIQLDSQTLLETAFSFKITNSLLMDLELFFRLKENPIQPKLLRAFTKLSLQEEKNKYYWIILPAAPEDIKSLLKNQSIITEEDVETFFQTNIKHRKLREIVEELQTDEDSEIANVNIYAIEKKDIQNAKMLQPSQRKKETLHSKYAQNAQQQSSRKKQFMHFNTDSNNTILELTNDFSKGGHSNGKANQNNSSYYSQLGHQNDISKGLRKDIARHQSDVTSNNSNPNKLATTENLQNLHQSIVMKQSEDMLVTPRKMLNINNDLTAKSRKLQDSSQLQKDNESPFIQIGSKIKSIFGNFFKTQDKLNKSYEELQNDQMTRANFVPLSQFEKQQSPASQLGAVGTSGKSKIAKQARSKSIHQSVMQRESPDIRIATQTYNSNQNVKQRSPNVQMSMSTVRDSQQYQMSMKSNIQMKAMHHQSSSVSQTNPLINGEDYHHVPSNHEEAFGGQQLLPNSLHYQPLSASIDLKGTMAGLRIHKQSSKSLERGIRSDGESMVQEEDEECEVDLLSQSADYQIGRVGDVVQLKKHQEFGASKRPEILIARDFIAQGDEEIVNHTNMSNSRTLDIQNLTINGSKMNMSSQLSQTIKINTSTQSSSSQALFNLKKHQAYNSNNPKDNLMKEVPVNIKTMKSSPPVSPKERYAPNGSVTLPLNSRITHIKGNQLIVNKKK